MATISQIRGALLEEVLLYLLRFSGYKTIETANNDSTLNSGASGLEVLGRGGKHQIDAIADYSISPPFSHPQRLLVEAKCFTKKSVGIGIVRNAVGVLKDVQEYWFSAKETTSRKKRYHYQYAIFSASGYSSPAEHYAFAQDIYLITLQNSSFFKPILNIIKNIKTKAFGSNSHQNIDVALSELRAEIRNKLKNKTIFNNFDNFLYHDNHNGELLREKLNELLDKCWIMNGAILGVLQGQFPVFLIPSNNIDLSHLKDHYNVKIFFDGNGWHLREGGVTLFSFDLPGELFNLYSESGHLTKYQALKLKGLELSQIQAITLTAENKIKVITFSLDQRWLNILKENLETKRARNE